MACVDELTARDRARIYTLLADVFSSAPTEERTATFYEVARALGRPVPDHPSISEVDREYMDLLVVPNPRYVAPYESAYRDRCLLPARDGHVRPRAGLLMGDSTVAVRQAFVDAGVRPLKDLPDHVANELRLVGHLWHVEAFAGADDAIEAARQRASFVAEHPLQWVAELGSKIAQGSRCGFYRAALEVAHTLLRAESTPQHDDTSVAPRATMT